VHSILPPRRSHLAREYIGALGKEQKYARYFATLLRVLNDSAQARRPLAQLVAGVLLFHLALCVMTPSPLILIVAPNLHERDVLAGTSAVCEPARP
jgi:hypothetical protein